MTKTRSTCRLALAAVFTLFLPVLAVHATGSDPMPQDPATDHFTIEAEAAKTPLMQEALALKMSEQALHLEVNSFLKKLAKKESFAQSFQSAADAAFSTGDVSQVVALVKEGGVQQGDVGVGLDQASRTITITIKLGGVTIIITINI